MTSNMCYYIFVRIKHFKKTGKARQKAIYFFLFNDADIINGMSSIND